MKENERMGKKERKEDINILHCNCLVGGICTFYTYLQKMVINKFKLIKSQNIKYFGLLA